MEGGTSQSRPFGKSTNCNRIIEESAQYLDLDGDI
jgi:hypothetical protein